MCSIDQAAEAASETEATNKRLLFQYILLQCLFECRHQLNNVRCRLNRDVQKNTGHPASLTSSHVTATSL